jgi:iron(II)-dependent oxidoreductase
VKRPERGAEAADQEIDVAHVRVQLRPVFGVKPGAYLTALYSLVAAIGLFFLLVYPGLRSRGVYVTFTSTPAGAAIMVDGSYRGATPAEVLVKAGARKVEVSLPHMKPVAVAREFRGPVFGTLFVKPRERIGTELELADVDGYFASHLQEYSDYAHEPAGSSLAYMARILSSPKVAAPPGIREGMFRALEAAMPLLAPPAGDLADFLDAEAIAAADGGVLGAAGVEELARRLVSVASRREFAVYWAVLNLPAATAQKVMKASWFLAAHERLVAAGTGPTAGSVVAPRGGTTTVAGIVFRPVPGGVAIIGDDTRPAARAQTVTMEPPHAVIVVPLFLGETEVTNRQYAAFLSENPVWRKGNLAELMQRGLVEDRYLADWAGDAPPAGKDAFPVTGVSYFAARAFCVWLTGKLPASLAGYAARLPYEAEWEWAARGGLRGVQYPGGTSAGDAPFRIGGQEGAVATGTTAANGYGLRETMGNVWEWCEDWYAPAAYLMASTVASRNVANTSLSIPVGSERVVRGGSWANEARQIGVYTRGSQPPSWTTAYTGFRVAVAAP